MKHSRRTPLLMAAAVAALLAACTERTPPGFGTSQAEERVIPPTVTAEKSAGTGGAATSGADSAITAGVKAQLARDAQLAALPIEVEAVDGRVALKGTVTHPTLRERATQLAQSVAGVVAVDNRLTVIGG